MSMWYEVDGVLILNEIDDPAFTLIAVPKPWIDGSPAPFTNQSDVGSPGNWFSHAMRDNEHPAACAIPAPGPTAGNATRATKPTIATRQAEPTRPDARRPTTRTFTASPTATRPGSL